MYALQPGAFAECGRSGADLPRFSLPPSQPAMSVVETGKRDETARRQLTDCVVAIAETGSQAAFATLFRHFAPRVKAYLIRLGVPAAQAEDIAQETLLSVWRKARSFDPTKAEAATWIFAIARNQRIDMFRRERYPTVGLGPLDLDPTAPETADQLVEATERETRIRASLKTLPNEQADVVRASFFDDKPHREIERELGIPLGTVKSRLRLAMERLRAALGDEP